MLNILNTQEYIWFSRVFDAWLSFKGKAKADETFVIGIHILHYSITNSYDSLNLDILIYNFNQSLCPSNNHALVITRAKKIQTEDLIFIYREHFLLAIKLLFYCSLSISLRLKASSNTNCQSILKKNQNFIKFLFKLKKFLTQNHSIKSQKTQINSQSLNKGKKPKLKLYYTFSKKQKEVQNNITWAIEDVRVILY